MALPYKYQEGKSLIFSLNPFNWNVSDYTHKKTFENAFKEARNNGEKEFIFQEKRYNTNYAGSPQTQLKETGITNDRLGVKSKLSDKAYNTIKPSVYKSKEDVLIHLENFKKAKNRFDNTEKDRLQKEYLKEGRKSNYNINKIHALQKKLDSYNSDFHGEDDPYSEDAWQIYLGKPQTKNTFSISKYKPSKSKENSINYYSLPDKFKDEIVDLYTSNKLKKGVNKEFLFNDIFGESKSQARVLGNFTVDEGKDEKGNYISYYDKYDLNPNLPLVGPSLGLSNFVGEPFEIYDRVYIKDYGTGKKERMYYSDNELSKLNIKNKNFDTLALQKELKQRGYLFPKSTKKDNSLDGVLGNETKNALFDWQIKHNKLKNK